MSQEVLEHIAKTLEEQLKWTKLVGIIQLKSIFERVLNTDEEKLVYELSDGERSIRVIEKLVGVGRTKIVSLWKKWYRMGLMESSAKYEGKRMRHAFSLGDVGIDVPALPQSVTQAEEEEFQ